jgi:hypothetical protein
LAIPHLSAPRLIMMDFISSEKFIDQWMGLFNFNLRFYLCNKHFTGLKNWNHMGC